jgi:hypothetical protein
MNPSEAFRACNYTRSYTPARPQKFLLAGKGGTFPIGGSLLFDYIGRIWAEPEFFRENVGIGLVFECLRALAGGIPDVVVLLQQHERT